VLIAHKLCFGEVNSLRTLKSMMLGTRQDVDRVDIVFTTYGTLGTHPENRYLLVTCLDSQSKSCSALRTLQAELRALYVPHLILATKQKLCSEILLFPLP
jgi:hypothetical protein